MTSDPVTASVYIDAPPERVWEYFTQPGFVGWCKKQFFTAVGQVPIDRSSG